MLLEHMVLNCGLNPNVKNFTRSFTHSVLVSIKKYLFELAQQVSGKAMCWCAWMLAALLNLYWYFWIGGKGKEERCETTVETQKVYVLGVAGTVAEGEA